MPPVASPPSKTRLRLFAIGLLSVAAFMFVSIIVKTALQGP